MSLKKPKMRNTLTNISIRGYKSINEEQEIELKPLTILAVQIVRENQVLYNLFYY
ncbi:hypothetical protein NMK43_13345 [Bacillus licheniformis]|uniref:hypothetical protein n=1 Tax=Bacillus licheniformis TaxID=1402 RepID=UPI00130EFCEF|nr:hypothetical protein [Bacillus licheniformis]MCP8974050.1 hypothetical protein [Bacillus licheniformis]